jgi:pimeloyl-ACP methyl ester carboxylesterase
VLRSLLAALALVLTLTSCAHTPPPQSPAPPANLKSPFVGFESAHYKDPKTWLCLPGRDDACARDLDATELLPDGTRQVVRDAPAAPPKVDCFYVYPTVDLSFGPGNHEDFDDVGPMARATFAQVARFRSVCSLYVPLYRQVTIGTYFRKPSFGEPYFDVAASDVVDAFLHYMGQYNRGRKIVLLGHSQGGQVLVRLLKKFFDDDPAMRERLLIAMPIGWPMDVEKGKTTGGTFATIPVCTHTGETACVVGFRSYVDGSNPSPRTTPPPGRESICVNPAELAFGAPRPFARAFIPVSENIKMFLHGVDDVASPFALLRSFYSGRCVEGSGGFRYLAIASTPASGDRRESPIDMSSRLVRGDMGLHIFDYQFAQGDMIELVAQRVAALP